MIDHALGLVYLNFICQEIDILRSSVIILNN
jgi:hypothetical protein